MNELDRLRAIVRTTRFVTYTVGMFGVYEARRPTLPSDLHGKAFDHYLAMWARHVLDLYGVTPLLEPAEGLEPPRRARLVAANHRSPLDIVLLLSVFAGRILSRADLANWPFLGWAATRARTIYVDRDNRASGAQAIRAIRRALMDGDTVSIFPEGRTFRGDEVRPFRRGAFSAAAGLDVEIIPVAFAYPPGAEFVDESFPAHLLRSAGRPETPISMVIGAPFVAGRDTAMNAQRAEDEVRSLVPRARALFDRHAVPGFSGALDEGRARTRGRPL